MEKIIQITTKNMFKIKPVKNIILQILIIIVGIFIFKLNFKFGKNLLIKVFLIKISNIVKIYTQNKIKILMPIRKNSFPPRAMASLGFGGGQLVLLQATIKYRTTKLHITDIFVKKYFLYLKKFTS